MTLRPLLSALLVWAVLLAVPAFAAATAKDLPPAAAFVQKLGDTALLQLTDKSLPRAEREARARKLLSANFDVPAIARFAMGPAWRETTPEQKKEYTRLFEDMIVKTYASRFEDYAGQSFEAAGVREENDRKAIVVSRILQNGGPPVKVEWQLRKKDGQLKVVDVMVENISMGLTQRDDFAAVIQSGGGTVEALLESLRQRTAR
jgi:phospholipid transport system substrate-binding protein